jgi:hypothetical protein
MTHLKSSHENEPLKELLLQMLETELGSEQVYRTALTCVINPDLRAEWQHYLEETLAHQTIVCSVCIAIGLRPNKRTPVRAVDTFLCGSLVKAMALAKASIKPAAAQLVACECVLLSETKDQAHWELLGKIAESASGDIGRTLQAAFEAVEIDEGRHPHHTLDWSRELSMAAIGLPAVLPPAAEVMRADRAIDGASVAHRATA